MAQFEPYLTFNGNCAEAMRFYEKTFGGKLTLLTFAESPMAAKMAPGSEKRVMHARLELEGHALMASDTMPEMAYEGMRGVSVTLAFNDANKARRAFDALATGGNVQMPLQETFWVETFGMVVDRFGTGWMVSGGKSRM